ncbi:hypothetical protein FisN_5Lh146 [Fistulifera solaris]|uniref:CST complex subunit CTC1 n=1 Tax=Fistulifera solaris TaxID=1519565 RepID=A0A1Z5JIV3_FISSO|nr:hypothetical protein FisN_5Lh146 [Fistulifera solaris]|eukprot:GAX13947.1 hypothetical protein FisN_5Lh146 [Fistulifera solaris]
MYHENITQHAVLIGTIHFICELRRPGKKRKYTETQGPQIVGWSFRCNRGFEYLLSFPIRCYRNALRAWQQGLVVRLEKFASVPISTTTRFVHLIEVHEDGLIVPATRKQARDARIDKDNVWTLAQISLKEALDIHLQRETQNYRSYKDSQSRKYSFRATIQAVTPIFTLDPSDPFCLLQVEDEGYKSVLVFQREALACSTLLIPGETCFFHDVTRIAWKVPDELNQRRFAHFKANVPTHVFVVHGKHQVDILDCLNGCEVSQSLIGCITRVHTVHSQNSFPGSLLIQYIDLITGDETDCRLYLEYFPMSSTLQLSLRSGTTIMATKIHNLGQGHFAACSRSSIHVHSMRPDPPISNTPEVAVDSFTPFAHTRIRKSCFETALSTLISDFIEGFNRIDAPSFRHWTRSWLRHNGAVSSSAISSPRRNVYAEFFDHQDEAGDVEGDVAERSGCHLSRDLQRTPKIPFLLQLNDIQNEAIRVLQIRLDRYIANNRVRMGWTASFTLVAEDLNVNLNPRKCLDAALYSGGAVVSASGPMQVDEATMLLLSISNGHTVLPVAVESNADVLPQTHALFGLESITTSVLCLGTSPRGDNDVRKHGGADVCILPVFGGDSRFHGPCVMMRVTNQNWIFIVSFHLHANTLIQLSTDESSIETEAPETRPCREPVHLGDVALPTFDASPNASDRMCVSLLARKQFAFMRLKKGSYGGITLTLAHMPSTKTEGEKKNLSDPGAASLQSIDCRPLILLAEVATRQMEAFFSCSSIGATGLLSEQIATALAFWKMASSETQCCLLRGGFDEMLSGASTYCHSRKIAVLVPLNNFQRDPKRGYLRIRSTFDDMVAFPVYSAKKVVRSVDEDGLFDYIGGEKMIAGMLGRHRNRKQYGDIAIGELTSTIWTQRYDGVPTCSIGEMFRSLCLDLQSGTCTHIAPSLTRRVVGGTFLGVSFCRAITECSECFSQLVKSNHKGKKTGATRKNVRSSTELSFWNRARPPTTGSNGSAKSETPSTDTISTSNNVGRSETPDKSDDFKSLMVCPKRCGGQTAIKWECSGTLDDSTGQAKLYAERDAALLLLGLTKQFVCMIEEGAWMEPNGIVFSKAMAPNPSITHAISRAKYRAKELRRGCRISESDVLQHMEPLARADYLLQRHCRFSPEPSRDLIYYVLCKPMGDTSLHLKHTTIDQVSGQTVPTYTLPPLKLVLVDCQAVSSRGRQYDNDEQ